MGDQIAIPRGQDKAGAECEGILPEPVLAVTGSLRAGASFGIVATKGVGEVPGFEFRDFVGRSLVIDEQRELVQVARCLACVGSG